MSELTAASELDVTRLDIAREQSESLIDDVIALQGQKGLAVMVEGCLVTSVNLDAAQRPIGIDDLEGVYTTIIVKHGLEEVGPSRSVTIQEKVTYQGVVTVLNEQTFDFGASLNPLHARSFDSEGDPIEWHTTPAEERDLLLDLNLAAVAAAQERPAIAA